MKKIFVILCLCFVSTLITTHITLAVGESSVNSEATRPAKLRPITVKENKKNIKEKITSKRTILTGIITSLSTSQLTLAVIKGEMNGKSVVVNVTSETKILRRFGTKSSLSEFSVNDEIYVVGKWTDDIKTALDAKVIRNLSIQKLHGAFIGTVSSVGNNSLIINTLQRGLQTATVSSNTKIVDRREQTILFSDITVGNRIRVKGLLDKKNNTITEVVQIKNFTLPVKPTGIPQTP